MNVEPINADDPHAFDLCVLAAHNIIRLRHEAKRAKAEGRTASTHFFEQRARAEEAAVRNYADSLLKRRNQYGR
jgi:hypothetical protein